MWTFLADVVWTAHVAFLVFLPVGGFLAWRWPRVIWAHAVAIAVAIVSITINFDCPLTTWEQDFRRRAGHPYTDGFIDHYFTGHVYPTGYQWVVQLIFAACIVVSYALLVRRRHSHAGMMAVPESPGRQVA